MLYAGALAISAFTLRRGGAEFDEGIVLQAAARIADGQLPYADFSWPYGPGHAYLLGWSFDLFGPSLIGWRVVRAVADATVAVAVYALARRGGAPPWAALAGWLAAACAMAQPTSATPLTPALALGLLAIVAATGARPRVGLAAALTALAVIWRPDFGLYAGLAVLAALLLSPRSRGPRAAGPGERRPRWRTAAIYAGLTAALTLLAFLPFLIAAGPADLYDSLLGASLRERDWWTLPFPWVYDGPLRLWPPGALVEDAKDLLGFYLPALALAGLLLTAVLAALALRGRTRPGPLLAALGVLALGCLAYLLSRPDEFHATPLIAVLAAAIPVAAAPFLPPRALLPGHPNREGDVPDDIRRESPPRRVGTSVAAVAATAVLLAFAIHGIANRGSALLQPPELAAIDLPVADGAQAPPAEARALAQMARAVQRVVPPGEPIYTVTRRSDLVRFNQPLVYVLAGRPNPTQSDFGIQTSAAAQRELIAELERTRPRAIVRWTAAASTVREPNLRGRPTGVRLLDSWVADRYRLLARYGDYEILVPRDGG